MEAKRKYLAERMSELLRSRGFRGQKAEQADGSFASDAVYRSGKSKLIAEYKIMNLYRASDFRAAIGDAILRFRHGGGVSRSAGCRLLVGVLLQRMSRRVEADLQEYARDYLSDLQWIVLAEDGSGVIRVGEQNESVSVLPFRDEAQRGYVADRGSLFSPNSQWLFKVLFLPGLSPKYWGGPAQRPNSIGELADVSGVPQPSVSTFVSKAEQAGFLKRGPKALVVQHHAELLDDWGYALKNRARRAIGLNPLYLNEPEEKLLQKLRSYSQGQAGDRVAVGGHLGCHLLGLGRSNVRQARLYAEGDVENLLSALDLVRAPIESAQIALVVQSHNAAIFRGVVDVDGVSVCDALQCYFDVRFSYARGREQADYIYERVLQPHIEARA